MKQITLTNRELTALTLALCDAADRYLKDAAAYERKLNSTMQTHMEEKAAAIVKTLDAIREQTESEDDETYDCPIHGTGPGPDCPRC